MAREVQMKLITIHPHPVVRDRSEPGRGWAGGRRCGEYRRSRWEGKEGLRGEEDYNLECAEGNIEGAKQRQFKESGKSYRKERMECGVDDRGKGG